MTAKPKQKRVSVLLPPDLVDAIDEERGDLSLALWIEAAARLALSPATQEWRATMQAMLRGVRETS